MLMNKGFKINNKHTLFDFGAKLKTRTISLPAEKQITNSVPYMNGNYNFSRILGKACYENRELTYVFLFVKNKDFYEIENKKRKFLTWLYSLDINSNLYDYATPGLYYKVTIKNIEVEDNKGYCQITVTFEAYPFKIDYKNGNTQLWDTFNFETDVLQGYYEVTNSKTIKLVNNSMYVVKVNVICSAAMNITLQDSSFGIKYTANTGTNKELFTLSKGENTLIIEGTGTVYFEWEEEVI